MINEIIKQSFINQTIESKSIIYKEKQLFSYINTNVIINNYIRNIISLYSYINMEINNVS